MARLMGTVMVVGAAILRDRRCLAVRRGPGMSLAGQWEFPGGKLEPGETPEQALRRELDEELGLAVRVGAWLGRGSVRDGERTVRLDVYLAEIESGEPILREHDAMRWLCAEELPDLGWAAADVPVVDVLVRHLLR